MLLIGTYIFGIGLFSTLSYNQYNGIIPLWKSTLVSLFWPLSLLNFFLGLLLSFFGIIWLTNIGYASTLSEDQREEILKIIKKSDDLD